eukprot:snap_masked-scaffold_2-processed-gene-25.6-mRNA-1 protein AED:1.00 eAED:1.00 QI:0/-1/0/0/-1/1/1/0/346
MSEETPSPPKPWEKAGNAASASAIPINSDAPVQTQSVSSAQPASTPQTSTATNPAPGTQPQFNSYSTNQPYNNMGYGNTGGMYGMNSGYGGYGGHGGFGSGMYGNNMGMYGGGMGIYGGGMGGMGGMYPPSNMHFMLGSLQQTMGSFGQLMELLAANTNMVQYMFNMSGMLLEKVGWMSYEIFMFLTNKVDVKYYEQMYLNDPNPNKGPMPKFDEQFIENVKVERKKKVKNWGIGIAVLFLGYKIVKFLIIRSMKSKVTAADKLAKRWEEVVVHKGKKMRSNPNSRFGMQPGSGMYNGYGGYGGYGGGMYGNGMYGGNMYGGYQSGYGNYGGGMGYGTGSTYENIF